VRGFFYFSKGVEFFKTILFRWLCKLFDKALICVMVCAALAMCLQIGMV
tara:strand:+ start:267 stop:413 length:147 start_codon:yes stop_codon:yes gene_type:complete